ncbi:MAG TPA: MlaD family protein [Mycobacteriales bacterium]|jgi:phospholipid/cholesterol/gamma-HCH transport system substrate-binding protein|nr:MlaD family protein [Mycobacteriales bacterium]
MTKITPSLLKLIAFAAVTIFAMYVLGTTIANNSFGATTKYRADFTDVTGLNTGDDIRIAGVKVGKIDSIRIVHRKLAEVTFSVTRDRSLPTSTTALVRYRDLVGHRYIELAQGPGSDRNLRAGGTIPVQQTQPALDLTVLFNGFKPLFQALSPDDVNRLSYEIIQVFQGESGTVDDLLAHTASLTTTLASKDKLIGEVITNLNSVLTTINTRDQKLTNLIVQLQRLVTGLAQDRKAIGGSLSGINQLASTTAGLLADGRPALKSDISELRRVATTLNGASGTVNGVLQRLPNKLNSLTRTASYGSWFNFYLCGLQAKAGYKGIAILPGGVLYTPQVNIDQARCQ